MQRDLKCKQPSFSPFFLFSFSFPLSSDSHALFLSSKGNGEMILNFQSTSFDVDVEVQDVKNAEFKVDVLLVWDSGFSLLGGVSGCSKLNLIKKTVSLAAPSKTAPKVRKLRKYCKA